MLKRLLLVGSLYFWSLIVSHSWWLAIGLVLIAEGIGPFIAPKRWRNMVAQLSAQPDNQLRRMGGCLVVAGGVIAWFFWR